MQSDISIAVSSMEFSTIWYGVERYLAIIHLIENKCVDSYISSSVGDALLRSRNIGNRNGLSFSYIELNVRLTSLSKLTLTDTLLYTLLHLDAIDVDIDIWYSTLIFFILHAVVIGLQAMVTCLQTRNGHIQFCGSRGNVAMVVTRNDERIA